MSGCQTHPPAAAASAAAHAPHSDASTDRVSRLDACDPAASHSAQDDAPGAPGDDFGGVQQADAAGALPGYAAPHAVNVHVHAGHQTGSAHAAENPVHVHGRLASAAVHDNRRLRDHLGPAHGFHDAAHSPDAGSDVAVDAGEYGGHCVDAHVAEPVVGHDVAADADVSVNWVEAGDTQTQGGGGELGLSPSLMELWLC